MIRAEQITEPIAYHGEGPVWSGRWGGLRCVDMLAGDVLLLRDNGGVERLHVGQVAAAVRPRRAGGAVIGIERGFALEGPDGELTRLDELWSDESIRMNEGGCDPDGRFYCGSMAYDKRPGAGAVYRLDPDRSVRVVVEGVTISNGLDWSPDGELAYYNDTETYRTDVFDYAPESGLTNRRNFAQVEPYEGRPDGLTVDSEGGVWVAMNGAGVVRRYAPEGAVDELVSVPADKVTACSFGGAGLDELFVTTSRENLPPEADPVAGSLCRAAVGIRGQPTREFAG
ncbi:MAG TPA: SMP-30/gluconolactonase/LRE family protein [Solirubrobacterales bacterium]|nr:SMP-30/gluconolactonase/LRE family protein [Solirubrobacterales bacterium]